MSDLSQLDVTSIKGVGPSLSEKLARLDVRTVQDLLFLLPLRYEDRTRVIPIGGLRAGDRAVVEADIELSETVFRRRRSLLTTIGDGTGFLLLRFFYFSRAQQQGLAKGARIRCYGEARQGPGGLEMVHPEYRILPPGGGPALEDTLTPIYPTTEGVQQGRLRRLTQTALNLLDRFGLEEHLPEEVLARLSMPSLRDALDYLHHPPRDASLELLSGGRHPTQRRLAFEELLAHQLSLRQLRARVRRHGAPPLATDSGIERRFLAGLPFELTDAQQRVLGEISADLCASQPMLRLLQGDVGSGKTVVAAAAALQAVDSGYQAVLMAPTELLAEQHLQTLKSWFEPLGISVAWLGGRTRSAERRTTLAALAAGDARFAVGTHALFQPGVGFQKLGLIIVDEQHRFGVHQRLALREKGSTKGIRPHQLIMSATPIPRTLAMTAYADLDVSQLDERPPGRKPVNTVVVTESRRAEVVQGIERACRRGRQAYWVCPLIDESETMDFQAAEDTAARLTEALPELEVGLVHGRMKSDAKETVMAAFKAGEIHVLVATTVIEVGVDVANATLMVIENAERMGLAQLHQLRGRVGRGEQESNCVLLYKPPLSRDARARLEVLRKTDDGFEVARRDLELRGPGEVLGTRQTGLMQLRIADLLRDADLLPQIQETAAYLIDRDPAAVAPLLARWIGHGSRYGQI